MTSYGHNSVSNNRQLDCLFNSLFSYQQWKHLSSALPALSEENLPFAGGFLSQRASDAESYSMTWRHPDERFLSQRASNAESYSMSWRPPDERFLSQRASNAESYSMSWRHPDERFLSQRASNAESYSMSWRHPDERALLTWFSRELD